MLYYAAYSAIYLAKFFKIFTLQTKPFSHLSWRHLHFHSLEGAYSLIQSLGGFGFFGFIRQGSPLRKGAGTVWFIQ